MLKNKNILRMVFAGILLLALFLIPIYAQESQSTTATEEVQIAKHWSKYAYPTAFKSGQTVHIIEKGDTLWDLAGKYLNDNFLWPKLWEANKYISDAHWIYPGDPVLIPADLIAVKPEDIKKIEEKAKEGELKPGDVIDLETGKPVDEAKIGFLDDEEFLGDISSIRPVAKYYDLYCYDTVLPDENMFDAHIISAEKIHMNLGMFDYVYIDLGEMHKVKTGDKFIVMQIFQKVYHPEDNSFMGYAYSRVGKITVVMTFLDFSIARVTEVCSNIKIGDQIRPDFDLASPVLLEELKPVDYYVERNEKPKGFVVHGQSGMLNMGVGHLCVIDLGEDDKVRPGGLVLFYRDNMVRGLPRAILGQGIILVVEENTAVVKIMQSRDFINVGDMVEVR